MLLADHLNESNHREIEQCFSNDIQGYCYKLEDTHEYFWVNKEW